MDSLKAIIPDFIKPTLRFLKYRNERNKLRNERAIRIIQDNEISKYDRNEKKLIVFGLPGAEWETGKDRISGGLISIISLYKESLKLRNIHGSEVILCTMPGEYLLHSISSFDTDVKVFRFEQIFSHFPHLEELIIHIPEFLCEHFFKAEAIRFHAPLKLVPYCHINILNQNIRLMPEKELIQRLKVVCEHLTITTAHQKYCTAYFRDYYGVPLHKLSVWISPEQYHYRAFEEKENLIVISPDPSAYRQQVLALLSKIDGLNVKVIQALSYDEYKKLISRAKWSLTFGEGLDGYFIEPVFSGAIGFGVFNRDFFTDDFEFIPGVIPSYEDMLHDLSRLIIDWNNEIKFKEVQNKQFEICARHYNIQVYQLNIELFYKGDYTYGI